jgi:LPXTG-site transpeptidase (sortase) family protein
VRTKILLILIIVLSVFAVGISAITRQKLQQPNDAYRASLEKAVQRANHPLRRVVHTGQILGTVQIPRLGLTVPYVEGSDTASLAMGAGHVLHTAFPGHRGNAGIAAHRDTCFRPLRFIRPGDDVIITTPDGMYDYVVKGAEIVLPTDGQVLRRTPNKSLTLVTCYPFFYLGSAPKRFIVHAEERVG